MSNGGDILDPILYARNGKTVLSVDAEDLLLVLSGGDIRQFLSRRGAILATGACAWSSSGSQTSWTVDIRGAHPAALAAYRADVSARAAEYEAVYAEIEADLRALDPGLGLSETDKDEPEHHPTWTLCGHRRGIGGLPDRWLRCADLLAEIDEEAAAAHGRGHVDGLRTGAPSTNGVPRDFFVVAGGRTAASFGISEDARREVDAALAAAGTDWISARAEAVGNGAVWADSDGVHLHPGAVSDEDAAFLSARLSGLSAAEEAPRLSAHEKLDLLAKLASLAPEALFVRPQETEDAWDPDTASDGDEIPF